MRVFQIAPPWIEVPPPTYGGTETVLDVLCRALARRGHEVVLFAPEGSSCPVEVVSSGRCATGTRDRIAAAELRHVRAAYRAAERWRPDVIHDHTVLGPAIGAPSAPAPVVTTVHDPLVGDVAEAFREAAGRCAVVAISRAQADTAPQVPVAAVIHHGVDVGPGPCPPKPSGAPLVFLGRLSPDKGVDTAIAVARASGRELVIAGKCRDPEELEHFDRSIAPLLDEQIRFIGEVGPVEKRELLAGARCLLNPIRWPEPFGMVMIEALALGTPVVTTRCGAAPEIVEDGVNGVMADHMAGLTSAVERVGAISPEACRSHVARHFSGDRMGAAHEALYERVRSRFLPPSRGRAA